MKFANMAWIYMMLIPTGLVLFYYLTNRRVRARMSLMIQKNLIDEMVMYDSIWRRRLKAGLVVSTFCLLGIAVLRPQWGFQWKEVTRKGLDIMIALDTSKSMLAEDIKPNRFERSKLAIEELVKELRGDRIGLVAFSGGAFLSCPLTLDYNGFMLSLDGLRIGVIPKGGTSISSAIREAIRSYRGGNQKYKILIIITDGEDHEGDARRAAEMARENGIIIYCIGIGTKEGELIPLKTAVGFLKDRNGNIVKTRLDEDTLQEIALSTGGTYVRSTSREFGLDYIFKEKLANFEKREIQSKMKKNFIDRFQIPLGIAFGLLFLETLFRDRKGKKKREVKRITVKK